MLFGYSYLLLYTTGGLINLIPLLFPEAFYIYSFLPWFKSSVQTTPEFPIALCCLSNYKNSKSFQKGVVNTQKGRGFSSDNQTPSGLTKSFLFWFAGFTDSEGNFIITQRNTLNSIYFGFRFRIRLHIDDKATLDFIQKTLGVGTVYKEKDECIFIVYKRYALLPFFFYLFIIK